MTVNIYVLILNRREIKTGKFYVAFITPSVHTTPRSIVVRASARGAERPGFDPRPRHTKGVKNGRFALLSLALGINELGIRLGGSESI